jgi:PKD repeat protein
MAVTIANEQAAGTTGGFEAEWSFTPTAGNPLLLFVWRRGGSEALDPATPSGWTLLESNRNASSSHDSILCYGKTSDGTETSVTFAKTIGTDALRPPHIVELDGASFADIETATNTAPSATTSITTGSVTPATGRPAIIFGSDGIANDTFTTRTHTPGAGWTELVDSQSGQTSGPFPSLYYKIVASTSGSYNPSTTASAVGGAFPPYWRGITIALLGGSLTADFSGTPMSGNAPLEVDFTDESTGSPSSWSWDFGDGGTSTSQNPTHTYTAPGVYTVTLEIDGGDSTRTRVGYITVSTPGAIVHWSDEVIEDITEDLVSCRRQRGAGSLADGGSYTGSATIVVRNRDNRYNPENTEGPLFGLLRDGARVWVGINKVDGTIIPDPAKTVKGVFAGRVTDVTVIPAPGAPYPSFVEFTCEDPLAWIGRTPVTIIASRHRSQLDLRTEILAAANEPSFDLCAEPTTLPLSYADGLAGNLLDELNRANGTRHFARPLDNPDDWYEYVTVRRTQKLDGAADATLSASDDHATGTSGWKTSSDTVINQQRATVEPVRFTSYQAIVWEAQDVAFPADRQPKLWIEFDEFVDGPVLDVNVDGSATASITPFGKTALIELDGTGSITKLNVQGALARRSAAETVTVDDLDSQDDVRGVRAGSDLSGDFLGTLTSARGIAAHIVWRYADGKYRPDLVVENWFPEQFELEPYDLIAFTSSHIGVAARIFEILGDTLDMNLAASPSAVHHVTTFQLMESRVQEARTWFTLDQSLLDSETDLLAY